MSAAPGLSKSVVFEKLLRRQALSRAASADRKNGTLARHDADVRCDGKQSARQGRCESAQRRRRNRARPALARQGERRECQRVSTKTPHPQEHGVRDRVRPPILPLIFAAPVRHPNGLRLWAQFASADRAGCPQGSAGSVRFVMNKEDSSATMRLLQVRNIFLMIERHKSAEKGGGPCCHSTAGPGRARIDQPNSREHRARI